MPGQRHRGNVLMLYQQAYHDQLLKDMHLGNRRKVRGEGGGGGGLTTTNCCRTCT